MVSSICHVLEIVRNMIDVGHSQSCPLFSVCRGKEQSSSEYYIHRAGGRVVEDQGRKMDNLDDLIHLPLVQVFLDLYDEIERHAKFALSPIRNA